MIHRASWPRGPQWLLAAVLASGASPASLRAQHEHVVATDTAHARSAASLLAAAAARSGSGTSWLPGESSMRGVHLAFGEWRVMIDGTGNLLYARTTGIRRQWLLGSTNWAMAMADRAVAGGVLQLRTMLSAEPATLTSLGYPLLLQVAEPRRDGMLTDRQHPHELLSELAIRYTRALTRHVAAELYVAPSGEPALGPPAYRHRPSAIFDPTAPLGTHAQDATHTTFGVVTLGMFTRLVKVEASIFDGAHADENRADLDLGQVRLRSYAGRMTVNPTPWLSLSGSWASIDGGDGGHEGAHAARHRVTASVLHTRSMAHGGEWASAAIYGVNRRGGGARTLPSLLVESSIQRGRTTVFTRAEQLRRSAEELALTGSVSPELDIRSLAGGIARGIGSAGPLRMHLGVRGAINLLPRDLAPFYGSLAPVSGMVFGQLQPRDGTVTTKTPDRH